MREIEKAAGVIAGLLDQRPMLDAAPSVIRDIQATKIAQALASQGLLLPEGFVAVKGEPTEAMTKAGAIAAADVPPMKNRDQAAAVWRAMIQAQETQG